MTNLPHRAGRQSHKELIIEYLVDGNTLEDLAEQLFDKLSIKERNEILDEIDNRDLEEDHGDHHD